MLYWTLQNNCLLDLLVVLNRGGPCAAHPGMVGATITLAFMQAGFACSDSTCCHLFCADQLLRNGLSSSHFGRSVPCTHATSTCAIRHQGGRAHLSSVPAGLSRASLPTPSGCDPDFQARQPPGSMFGPLEGDQEVDAPTCFCRVCWAKDAESNLLNPCSCKGLWGAETLLALLAHQAAPGSVSAIAGGSALSGRSPIGAG